MKTNGYTLCLSNKVTNTNKIIVTIITDIFNCKDSKILLGPIIMDTFEESGEDNWSIFQHLTKRTLFPINTPLFRFLPYVMPESKDGEGAVDLSTLRTFRVLRPLKLVSGVPSK